MEVINNNNGTFSVIREILLTTEEISTLKRIVDRNYWEFRGNGRTGMCRENIHKESVCRRLEELGFLDDGDGMAWHLTFYPTELGKKIVSLI